MSIVRELRRRRVFRLAGLYLIGAWLVLQIADVIFEPLGLPEWAMGSLIWMVVAGFFVAVGLSWRYDLGAHGIVRATAEGDASSAVSPLNVVDYLILAGGVLVIGFIAWAVLNRTATRESPPATGDATAVTVSESVAVLPFANFTGNDELTYYGDGVAEEVTHRLSRVPGLSVLAFNVSSRIRDPMADPREVARDLGVEYVVSGTLRPFEDRFRVSASLVAARTGVQLWSMAEETRITDAFVVQARISDSVAAAMQSELNLDPAGVTPASRPAPDAEAYDLYLRGRSLWSRRGVENVREAVDFLSEAVRVDPNFARGWSALASAYLTWPGYSPEGYRTWHLAEDAANKALALDDSLAEPRAVLAAFRHAEYDWVGAARLFEEALTLEPGNATIQYWFSEHLGKVGRLAASTERLAIARSLDPTYPPIWVDSMFSLMYFGRYEDALIMFEDVWAGGVRSPVAFLVGYIASVLAGDFDRARALLDEVELAEPQKATYRAFIDVQAGTGDADLLIERLAREPETRPQYVGFVWLASMLGATDLAMALLQERVAAGQGTETRMLWGPGHRLMEHPDFPALVADVGFVDYWTSVAWPDLCGLERAVLVCRPAQPAQAPDALEALNRPIRGETR